MSFLDNMKEQTTVGRTENGAKTYTSTLNANLDFFSQAGAMRSRMEDVKGLFAKAYDENKELALRNLVHLRNIRLGGLGEREAFREAFKYVVDSREEKTVTVMMDYVAFIGRWDDLVAIWQYAIDRKIYFVEDHALALVTKQLREDIVNFKEGKEISLMAKWLPNTNTHKKVRRAMAYRIARKLGFEGNAGLGNYRKMLASLRDHLNLVEVRLASKDYDRIELEKLPSKALFRYRGAFVRHIPERYSAFLAKVESGEVKMNAKLMLPHEIIHAYSGRSAVDRALEATWNSLDNVLEGVQDNAIVVADTSGSMEWANGGFPWEVAEGLAIYTAERLEGAFKGHFITFSTNPKLIQLPLHGTLLDKMREYSRHSIVSDTNIARVFELILKTALANHTPQSELPSKIIIISDMEFNSCVDGSTNFESAKRKFKRAGYELPDVVFWNVNSRNDNVPVRKDESGVALVSGFTPNILRTVLGAPIVSPEEMMLEVLNTPAYNFVREAL